MTWIGNTDLRAPKQGDIVGIGPIAQALQARSFDEVTLISDYEQVAYVLMTLGILGVATLAKFQ